MDSESLGLNPLSATRVPGGPSFFQRLSAVRVVGGPSLHAVILLPTTICLLIFGSYPQFSHTGDWKCLFIYDFLMLLNI